MALDVGERRIGIATGDAEGGIASPFGVIQRRSTAGAVSAVLQAVAEQRAELVVVGLPLSLDGQPHSQAERVRAFAERLRRRLAVPLVYQDETLSTVRAEDALRAAGVRPERIRERIDAAAAAIILQEYLDAQRQEAQQAQTVAGGEREEARSQ
jgi:putative holliday junction resolvase